MADGVSDGGVDGRVYEVAESMAGAQLLEEDLVEFEHIVVYDFLDVLLDIFV